MLDAKSTVTRNLTQQRKYEIWAGNLLFLSLAVSTLFGYLTHSGLFDPDLKPPSTPVQLILTISTMAGLDFCVWKGYRWAKALMILLLAAGAVKSYLDYINGVTVGTDSLHMFHTSVQWLMQGASVVLLLLSFKREPSTTYS